MRFGIDYDIISLQEIGRYDLVILEQDRYSSSELNKLTSTNTQVLGYLSMSEVHPSRSYFEELKENGLLDRNENWGSYHIDLEDTDVRTLLLDSVVTGIMSKGLDGLMLDTVEGVAPYTGFSYMSDEMVSMIREIRKRYPDTILIQNGGLFLLDQTRKYVNGVLLESTATAYDFERDRYTMRQIDDFRRTVQSIQKYSSLVDGHIYLVEYVNSNAMAEQVRQRLDSLRYPYFISRIELDSLQMYSGTAN